MAAVVWKALVLLMFLFVCSAFSHSPTISFTRDELLDIRQHTTCRNYTRRLFSLFSRFSKLTEKSLFIVILLIYIYIYIYIYVFNVFMNKPTNKNVVD